MHRSHALAAAMLALLASACGELPTNPDEARERLSRGRNRIVDFSVPVPSLDIRLAEELGDSTGPFGDLVDTTTFALHLQPDVFAVGAGEFMQFDTLHVARVNESFDIDIDTIRPAPVVERFDLSIDPYTLTSAISISPVAVTIPQRTFNVPLFPQGPGQVAIPLNFGSEFATATFAGASVLRVTLTTGPGASLAGASLRVMQGATPLTPATAPVDVPPSSTRIVSIPLDGVTMPSSFSIALTYTGATGTASFNDAALSFRFADASITSATGVAVANVAPTVISERVALSANSGEFSSATLASGTLALRDLDLGSLVFTPGPGLETNLAGKRVGGPAPDSVLINGIVSAPPGAATVDISTTGSATADVSNLSVSAVTLNEVDFDVSETVDVLDENDEDIRGATLVRVATGTISLVVRNRLPVPGTISIALAGATAANGQPVTRTAAVAPAGTSTIVIDLAGATLVPALLDATLTGSFGATNVTVTAAMADSAVVVTPVVAITPASVTMSVTPQNFPIDTFDVDLVDDDDPDFVGVQSVRVAEGVVQLRVLNNLPVGATVDISLRGATDAAGQPVRRTFVIAPSAGGVPATSNLIIDLAGATLLPAELRAVVVGAFTPVSAVITREAAAAGFAVDPLIALRASSVTVANASSLTFGFDEVQEFDAADFGLDELDDVLEGAELMDVALTLDVRNRSGLTLVLDSLRLGLLRQDGTPITGSDGRPLTVQLGQGGGRVVVAPNSTVALSAQAAALVNALVQELIAGRTVGLAASGVTGLGGLGTLTAADSIEIGIRAVAPLDVRLPAAGILFEHRDHASLDFEQETADMLADLHNSLVSGELELAITNATPLGMSVRIAIAPTPADTAGFDPFTATQKLVITGVNVTAAQTNAAGVVTTPAQVTTTAAIPVDQLEIFRQQPLSVAVEARLLPPAGGRARLTRTDFITIRPRVKLRINTWPGR